MEQVHRWAQLRLQAYYDGELDARASQRVAAHLADCELCRQELATLASLSSLLQEAPPAPDLLPEERFVANVGLRLARRPAAPLSERIVYAGWRWVPAVLVGLWAFFQAVSWMTSGILALLTLNVGIPELDLLPETLSGFLPGLGVRWGETLLTALGIDFVWSAIDTLGLGYLALWLMQLGFYAFLGLAIWSWAASWWARERHRQLERPT